MLWRRFGDREFTDHFADDKASMNYVIIVTFNVFAPDRRQVIRRVYAELLSLHHKQTLQIKCLVY